jgi:hypothetical protein
VFTGVEHESEKSFLFPFTDGTADALIAVTVWLEPGTTLISDCWAVYRDIAHDYIHRTVIHAMSLLSVLMRTSVELKAHGAM